MPPSQVPSSGSRHLSLGELRLSRETCLLADSLRDPGGAIWPPLGCCLLSHRMGNRMPHPSSSTILRIAALHDGALGPLYVLCPFPRPHPVRVEQQTWAWQEALCLRDAGLPPGSRIRCGWGKLKRDPGKGAQSPQTPENNLRDKWGSIPTIFWVPVRLRISQEEDQFLLVFPDGGLCLHNLPDIGSGGGRVVWRSGRNQTNLTKSPSVNSNTPQIQRVLIPKPIIRDFLGTNWVH